MGALALCGDRASVSTGEHAPSFVAERLGAMALAGDVGGVATWKVIAALLAAEERSTSNQ
jgi:hypothetical protein